MERDLFYCGDPWCDGHALPSQVCPEEPEIEATEPPC
jgi:hypothetical protein